MPPVGTRLGNSSALTNAQFLADSDRRKKSLGHELAVQATATREAAVRLLLPPDQETGVGGVDRNQLAMLVSGRAETFARPSDDVGVLIPDERVE